MVSRALNVVAYTYEYVYMYINMFVCSFDLALPIKAAEECTHVAIVVTARGGHIGFLEGWWPSPKEQYMGRLFTEFFTKALFDEDGHFERTRNELHQRFDDKKISPLQAPIPQAISKVTTPLLSTEELVEKFMEM